jgi:hypothetical protein
VFDEGGVKAGRLGVVLGGRDPQRAAPHPTCFNPHQASDMEQDVKG